MSTLALRSAYEVAPAAERKPKLSLFQRLIKAREQEALRRIHTYLASQADDRLADMGYTAEDIEALRAGKLKMPAR